MSKEPNLGDFEQVVLLAILRLREEGAYGVSIRSEICSHTNRKPAPGAIYTTLDRLEKKALVESFVGEATPERGGRAKRYYRITTQGLEALQRSQRDYSRLSRGLNLLGGTHG